MLSLFAIYLSFLVFLALRAYRVGTVRSHFVLFVLVFFAISHYDVLLLCVFYNRTVSFTSSTWALCRGLVFELSYAFA